MISSASSATPGESVSQSPSWLGLDRSRDQRTQRFGADAGQGDRDGRRYALGALQVLDRRTHRLDDARRHSLAAGTCATLATPSFTRP